MSDDEIASEVIVRMMRDVSLDEADAHPSLRCEGCGRRVERAPFARSTATGGVETLLYCEDCARTAAIMGTTVTVSRKEMLRIRDLADKRMLPSSLYRGKRIIGYRESMGGDNKWHAQVVLEGDERIFLDQV